MVASKLQMHVSSLPDKISTKFRRLCLCFRGLAFHWDSSHDYATKPEVVKSKMAASELQMHVSPLPDKISKKFQRLYLFFRGVAFHKDSWKYYETKPEVEKFKMATSQLLLRVSALSDKISTGFQRLNLRFWGPAFHWNLWEWCATKPEVENTKCSANARLFDLFSGNDTHMITKVSIN